MKRCKLGSSNVEVVGKYDYTVTVYFVFCCCFVANCEGHKKAASSLYVKITDNIAVVSSELRSVSVRSWRRDWLGWDGWSTKHSWGSCLASLGWPGHGRQWVPRPVFPNVVSSAADKTISQTVAASGSSLAGRIQLWRVFLRPLAIQVVGSIFVVVLPPGLQRQLLQRDGLQHWWWWESYRYNTTSSSPVWNWTFCVEYFL